MKAFEELRESVKALSEKTKNLRVGRHKVAISKKNNKFVVHINNELLDSDFKSEKDAEKSAKDFIELMGEELQ